MRRFLKRLLALFIVRRQPPKLDWVPNRIIVPAGVGICAHEACAVFDVQVREEMLYYPMLHCPVPFSAEVIVDCDPGKQMAAERLAQELRARGWRDVTVESRQHELHAHETGEAGA